MDFDSLKRVNRWRQASVLVAIFLSAWLLSPALAQEEKTSVSRDSAVVFCSYTLKNWLLMNRGFGAKAGPLKGKPDKEKAAIIATLSQIRPDILGVCEIGSDEDFADLKNRLAAEGLDYPFVERCHGHDPDRSLGFLSRFPIVARNSQTSLNYQMGYLRLAVQRGFLDATVEVAPGFQLHCVGVHLKSMREITEADQAQMRRNEARLLRLHLNGILKADPTAKVLAYGDFNDHAKEPPIDDIRGDRATPELRMTDVPLRDINGENWTHFYDWQDSYSRLDYAFVSKALHPYVSAQNSYIYFDKDFAQASDHRPIVLHVSLKTTKSRASKAKR